MSQWAGPATVRSHCGGSDERTSAAYCPHCKGEQLRTTPALVAAVHPPACLPACQNTVAAAEPMAPPKKLSMT